MHYQLSCVVLKLTLGFILMHLFSFRIKILFRLQMFIAAKTDHLSDDDDDDDVVHLYFQHIVGSNILLI